MAGFGGKASAGTLSKAEYLKRYLGGGPPGTEETKKRRKKKSHGQVPSRPGGGRGMRIVDDDDIGWKDPASKQADAADEQEDLPVVAEFVDERPKEIKLMEEFRSGTKWKVLRDDREDSQGSDLSLAAKSTASSETRSREKETEEAGHSPKHSPMQRTRQDSSESSPSHAVRDTSPASSPQRRQRHDSSESSSSLRERLDSPELRQHRKPRHDSPDQSPPRKGRHDSPDQSTLGKGRHDSPDQSPPRKGRHDSPDQSPLRKGRHDSPDQSPVRKGRHDSPDQSPLRKGRHESPGLSPRGKKYAASPDLSPPRKGRRTSPDLSPPRKGRRVATDNTSLVSKNGKSTKILPKDRRAPSHRKDSSSSDLSPPRYKRHDSGSDMSPPRKKQTTNGKKTQDSQVLAASKRRARPNNSTSPPPRRPAVRPASDLSPPRNRGKPGAATHGSDSDLSPPRKTLRKSSDSDLSPPRRASAAKHSPLRQRREDSQSSQMLSGGIAGLVSADVLRKEKKDSKQKERENKPLEEESKTAATVFRDKSGRKRDLQAEREEKRRAAGVKSQRDEQYAQWGQGLAQRQMQQQNVLDAAKEIDKPLARYIDDQDLDQMLREQERDGDPMANFIKKKKGKEDKTKKARPRYNGPEPPPNRFNIYPGHRWDGVDRSNGFEQKRFARQSDKKAVQELAYKWSVEDM